MELHSRARLTILGADIGKSNEPVRFQAKIRELAIQVVKYLFARQAVVFAITGLANCPMKG
jgi:hypothetical protein